MREEKIRETLGQRLKKIRQEKGLTLEEASEKTRVHLKVLNAIEQDTIESLSNPFYARAFVKSYARFLGVGDDELIRQFLSGAKKPVKQLFFLEGEREKERHKVPKVLRIVFIVLVSLVFLLLSLSVARKFIKKQKIIKTRPVSSKIIKPASSKVPFSRIKTKEQGKVEKIGVEKKEALFLTISAKEDSWLQLKRDGKIIFKGILAKNKKETWNAKNKFELWVGNAGTVELNLNGKDLGPVGKKGEIIKNITFTKEGMRVK